MATYNLDHSRLDGLLDRFVSSATENAILQALANADLLPHGRGTIGVDVESQGGAFTIPGPDHLFLDVGSSNSMTVTSQGGLVIGAGDGANWILDQGPGGDTLVGGAGAEKLQVTQGDNVLIAGGGLNTLIGGTGHDLLIGGGSSLLEAGAGGATLFGGNYFDHAYGDDQHDGGRHRGDGGNDGHRGDGRGQGGGLWGDDGHGGVHFGQTLPMDTLVGGSGDDLIAVSHGDNVIYAGTGHDTIHAGDGADTIYGPSDPGATQAMDTIQLGTGNTSIQGGAAGAASIYSGMHGNDTIIGSAGGQSLALYSDQSSHGVESTTVNGGVTTITFKDHQSLSLDNVTVHFSNGDILKV